MKKINKYGWSCAAAFSLHANLRIVRRKSGVEKIKNKERKKIPSQKVFQRKKYIYIYIKSPINARSTKKKNKSTHFTATFYRRNNNKFYTVCDP